VDDALRPVDLDRRQSVSIELILPPEMHHAGHSTAATEDVAILLDVGTAVYGEAIPDQPSRPATRSRSCIRSTGDPHGTHQREHGRLWRGHSRPAQPHGNFDLDRA
jgi:hypothetical protein